MNHKNSEELNFDQSDFTSDKLDIINKMKELAQKIEHHNYLYYVLNKPEISDAEFDDLFNQLKSLEEKYPELTLPYSPTKRVGSDLSNKFEKVKHTIPVLSLDKAYSLAEVVSWALKILEVDRNATFSCQEKFDGVSIVLYYKSGILSRAVSRGDGFIGNDITENCKTIKSIPLNLKTDISIVVRGEVYIDIESFNKYNEKFPLEYANPRNFAAGTLNRIKSSEVANIPLKFFAYDAIIEDFKDEIVNPEFDIKSINDDKSMISLIKYLGFTVSNNTYFFPDDNFDTFSKVNTKQETLFDIDEKSSNLIKNEDSLDEVFEQLDKDIDLSSIGIDKAQQISYTIESWINKFTSMRKSLPYQIDGVVFKVNQFKTREKLGYTGHHPRWAIAYKFEAPKGETKVKDVVWQVGRGGRLTPVAILEPVSLAGSVVSRATLHNIDYIKMLDLKINDKVSISKRGDIIPAVEEVLEKDENGIEIQIPSLCPSCGKPVRFEAPIVYCDNDSCPARLTEQLKYFASRDCMNIENLGEETIDLLVQNNIIKDFPDIYKFDPSILSRFEGYGDKKIALIRDGIEKSKKNDFETLLYSLGFKDLGKQTARLLIKAGFNSAKKLIDASKTKDDTIFSTISGIGEKTSALFVKHFSSDRFKYLMDEFEKLGFNLEMPERIQNESNTFSNTSWCITGTLKSFENRELAEAEIEKRGGKVLSAVSSRLTYLVCGENPGSKLQKAKELGVKILSEDEFLQMLKKGG